MLNFSFVSYAVKMAHGNAVGTKQAHLERAIIPLQPTLPHSLMPLLALPKQQVTTSGLSMHVK